MITASVSDIQKNPSIISQAQEPVNVVDKRKKVNIGVFYPKLRKTSSILDLAWSLGKYIPEDKKNVPWEEVRKKSQEIRLKELTKKYNLKK